MTGVLGRRLFQASAAAALAAILLGLGYLSTQGPPPTRNSPAEKLRIAVSMTPHSALLFIAAAKGFFAEEGIEVTMIPTIHGKAAIELVVQGKADVGAAAEVVFVLSAIKGEGLGIAANMFSSSNDMAVIAPRDDRVVVRNADQAGNHSEGIAFHDRDDERHLRRDRKVGLPLKHVAYRRHA